jgi:predicted branched-subunit amino acid permease
MRTLLWIAYLVVGIVVGADRNYFEHLGNVDNVASAIFAVLLWPLLLLGVDITLR